jgi:hypothetical protein
MIWPPRQTVVPGTALASPLPIMVAAATPGSAAARWTRCRSSRRTSASV